MPPQDAADVEKLRAACAAQGHTHRLWSGQELWARYQTCPAVRALERLRPHLPAARFAALAADWFRVRVLAEFGGAYFDTDIQVTQGRLPELPEGADLSFFPDRLRVEGCSNCAIVAHGERGKAAAEQLAEMSGQRLHELSAAGAASKWGLMWAIGPRWLWAEAFPALRARGFTVGLLSRELCSDHKGTRPLNHRGSGKWVRAAGDPLPPQHDPRPAWQRPRAAVVLPQSRQRNVTVTSPAPRGDVAESVRASFALPRGVRRIVLLANSTLGFCADDAGLREGDLVVHFSRARHRERALELVPRAHHWLICRSGGKSPRNWYTPSCFDGFEHVVFVDRALPLSGFKWWQDYAAANPGKCPTSGFIAAAVFRTLYPDVALVLAGFDPGVSHGSPMYEGHAWQYEADYYSKHNFNLIKPHVQK